MFVFGWLWVSCRLKEGITGTDILFESRELFFVERVFYIGQNLKRSYISTLNDKFYTMCSYACLLLAG